MTPKIIMIRHGATDLNDPSDERLRGWKDVPLSTEGIRQAHSVANDLENVPIDALFSSDLSRAMKTAEIVGKPHGMKPTADRDLRPWDQGEMTGKSVNTYVPVMMDYIRNKRGERMPGSSESFDEFKARFLKSIGKYSDMAKEGKCVVLVSHSRNERMLCGWLMKNGKDIDLFPLLRKEDPISPGGYLVINFKNGRWVPDAKYS